MAIRVGACLSLTGRYAHFGLQAAHGLEAWHDVTPGVDVLIEDDESRADRVPTCLRTLAGDSDLILGPYSTRLARAAAAVARDDDILIWNHGGAGDDVQALAPGYFISVLTQASKYGVPYVALLSRQQQSEPLYIKAGAGPFGKQVMDGAQAAAEALGLRAVRVDALDAVVEAGPWHVLCAGSFDEDVKVVQVCRNLEHRPRSICAVAAGVRRFAAAISNPAGIYGIAQWFPGLGSSPDVGPSEADLVRRYLEIAGSPPDYPAIQAAAAASLAAHCLAIAGASNRASMFAAAAHLCATTLFGRFAVDASTGAQMAHDTVLLRWTEAGDFADATVLGRP